MRYMDYAANPSKGSKYGNVKSEYRGVNFDSKAERGRAEYLDHLVKVGGISWWIPQPKLYLGTSTQSYRPDFFVMGIEGDHHFEDVKGHETQKFRGIKKAWRQHGPCDLFVIKNNAVVEEIHGPGTHQSGCGGML